MSKRYQGGVLGVGFNPLQAPNAPTIGAATATNQTVSVAFTAPANVGGSAISTYAVRVSPGNFSATGSSSPISVTGLTNDTTYTFSVAALNSYGPSPYSGTVTATPSFLAVEDVFSTWLYTGTGSTQTITNGINLSGQGGLVWFKARGNGIFSHQLYDTVRGATIQIGTNSTSGNSTNATGLTAFTSSGFTIGSLSGVNSGNMASWTFREAPKFFDVVTYTGNGVQGRTVAHSLGVAPGMIAIKRTDVGGDNWLVYHRSIGAGKYMLLNSTNGENSDTSIFNNTAPTATVFSLGNYSINNASGGTYVAYLFAHDTASDGIIQCGSYYVPNEASPTQVTLGWEPQFLLVKKSNTASNWWMIDNMRGFTASGADNAIYPNLTDAETAETGWSPTSTGFTASGATANGGFDTYIYMAIRRGPMRTPTLGTSVFSPLVRTGNGTTTSITSPGFVTDLVIAGNRTGGSQYVDAFLDRLRGTNLVIGSSDTTAETTISNSLTGFDTMTGYNLGSEATTAGEAVINRNTTSFVNYAFRRAPGFFDEVCYAGSGANRTLNHNLGVVPEFMIVKARTVSFGWLTYSALQGAANACRLDLANAFSAATTAWNSTAPTSTVLSLGTSTLTNASGYDYVGYLFASCPGVSKIGNYTGTGALQTVNCGFTSGARFVLIKRTDSTGSWYLWDSARGITSGNDPYILLDATTAEVTGTNYVDTDTTGFKVTAAAPAELNAVGGTYLFWAIS